MDVSAGRLDHRDGQLARAIHRTVLQRWLTLGACLDCHLTAQPLWQMEPALQAILLSAAAQLIFMERQPAHAVVHEAVELAKHRVRPGAGKLANAVLRRLADVPIERRTDSPWQPTPNTIPIEGGCICLPSGAAPPELANVDDMDAHLACATSHLARHVQAWRTTFGDAATIQLLLHDLKNAPIIVSTPHVDTLDPAVAQPHDEAGFAVWTADHAKLVAYLAGGEDRWVQDPSSARPVAATAQLSPQLIVDFCAGRGTKTRQLARVHRAARIIATDVDADRRRELSRVFAGHDRVEVVQPHQLKSHASQCDLVLLDVPCSNTGVLARRLEARYRYSTRSLRQLVAKQRSIIETAAPLLRRDGAVSQRGVILYCTCSLESCENNAQADWAAQKLGLSVVDSQFTLPSGAGATYHDGGYYTLLQ